MFKRIISALSVLVVCGMGLLAYLHNAQDSDTPKVRVIKMHNLAGQRMIVYQIYKTDGFTDTFCDVEPFGVPDEYILSYKGGRREFLNRDADATVPSHKRMTDRMIAEFSKLVEAIPRVIDVEAQPWSDARTDTPEEVLRKTSQRPVPLTEYVYKPIEP